MENSAAGAAWRGASGWKWSAILSILFCSSSLIRQSRGGAHIGLRSKIGKLVRRASRGFFTVSWRIGRHKRFASPGRRPSQLANPSDATAAVSASAPAKEQKTASKVEGQTGEDRARQTSSGRQADASDGSASALSGDFGVCRHSHCFWSASNEASRYPAAKNIKASFRISLSIVRRAPRRELAAAFKSRRARTGRGVLVIVLRSCHQAAWHPVSGRAFKAGFPAFLAASRRLWPFHP